jgi:hypothetical protein
MWLFELRARPVLLLHGDDEIDALFFTLVDRIVRVARLEKHRLPPGQLKSFLNRAQFGLLAP